MPRTAAIVERNAGCITQTTRWPPQSGQVRRLRRVVPEREPASVRRVRCRSAVTVSTCSRSTPAAMRSRCCASIPMASCARPGRPGVLGRCRARQHRRAWKAGLSAASPMPQRSADVLGDPKHAVKKTTTSPTAVESEESSAVPQPARRQPGQSRRAPTGEVR
jgi:hypothetical protein